MHRQQLAISALVPALLGVAVAAHAQAPIPLVPSGAFHVAYSPDLTSDPGTFWYTQPTCDGPGVAGNETSPALITRGATYGAAPRLLMRVNPPRPVATCNPYRLTSNIAADGGFIYFVDNQGPGGHWALQRRSRTANASDPSTLLADFGPSITSAEVNAEYPTVVMTILHRQGTTDIIVEHLKTTGALVNGDVERGPANSIRNFQYDGKFFYWINGSALRANDTTNGAKKTIVPAGVTTYLTQGFNPGQCSPAGCESDVAFVLYGQGNQIHLTDTVGGGGFPPQYTSVVPNATIQAIARDNLNNLYFFERRPAVPGGVFSREDRLLRNGVLIFGPVNNGGPGFDGLTTDHTHLYFHDRAANSLLKLAKRSAAIPIFDLQATGVEVTQGLQNPKNDVTLIEGKRTMVRFHVKSGDAKTAAGVTAHLDVFDTQKYLGRLHPVNRTAGRVINVRPTPLRMSVDDAFLFEVPVDWTMSTALTFSATVNPLAGTVEDNFTNNTASSPLLVFTQSPRMLLELVEFRYTNLGTLVTGGAFDDTDSVKWMRSLYPVASWTVGGIDDPGPGLRVAFRTVTDNALENRVNQTDDACNSLRCTATPTKRTCCDAGQSDADCAKRLADAGGTAADDRNMCAGNYVVQQLQAMRAAGTIPKDRYIYGSIAYGTAPATQFTRGFNPSGETIAVGPMKDPSTEQNYMAHEIGHAIGRGHPSSGGAPVCPNQSADDNAYPYVNARFAGRLIAGGPFGGPNVPDEIAHARMDFGPFGNSNIRIVGASTAGDIMSYCAPYGISPYNYAAIFSRLSFQPLGIAAGGPGGAGGAGAGQAAVPGDWLLALGNFPRESGAGAFGVVKRLDSVAQAPLLVDGGYVLELRGADDAVLASHAFTPQTNADEAQVLGFALVVPFAPGTRALRIVERATSRIVASRAVSAARPVVAGVQLAGSTGPVTGAAATVVTVQWTASDPDGDPLTYDLYYTHNGGATWQPIALSLQGTSVPVDTASLGGGTGQFRIEASDGAQTARAETAPFQMANKAPSVRIINPTDGFRTQWGQVVTFESDVRDPQEQALSRDSLVWSTASRVLGKGAGISVADLDVGSHLVTLTVTSAAGLTATATVTVIVGDVLRLPGPLLAAAPSRVAWSVGGRESAPQTSTLVVSNGGGDGALGFVVASNQPWLTVNGAASATLTAPATLTIGADPAGLADLSTAIAELRLTSVADPLDVLVVPVTVLKGNLVSGQPATEERTCTVATGETLATIAEREYGDAGQWPRIFEANRDRLSHPDAIVPGQKLRLP